jgi:hypothetical protein
MSPTSLYPRGNVLTEPMPFTARDGSPWLAYIEGVAQPREYSPGEVTLPGRRLRFDSAAESRATAQLPPGSPFLPEARLQDLLDQAQLIPPPPTATWHPREFAIHLDWPRRWREGASRRRVIRERVERLLSEAFDTTLAVVARLAFGQQQAEPEPDPVDAHLEGHSPVARRRRTPRWAHRPRSR